MILYLDASALVKEYVVSEPGAEDIFERRKKSRLVGTSVISRAETAAALGKAVRTATLTGPDGMAALQSFRRNWGDLIRIQLTESIAARADALAWEESLRGFDAIHLASALMWKEIVQDDVTFAAFDVDLWHAAGRVGLLRFPDDLPAVLTLWRKRR